MPHTTSHPSLRRPPCDLIAGVEHPLSGDGLVSINPARPDQVVWRGTPEISHADEAVAAARAALGPWSRMPEEKRFAVLHRARDLFDERKDEFASIICDETGKTLWDSAGEAGILGAKVSITLERSANSGMSRVTGFEAGLTDTRVGRCWFRPHGVMAVIGPFNFPAHLPNGHIVPALAMGNTVVFKPSDKTPGVGQLLAEVYREALAAEGAPGGVVNLVQGAAETAQKLTTHDGIDGVLFTGSWPVGRKILESNLDRPGRIVALEMGGNNAAVVLPDADLRQAAIECVRCAFITTGQRCTCTRRVIVHEAVAERFIGAVVKSASTLVVGDPRAEHPVFMGPPVNEASRDAVLTAQASYAKSGGDVLLQATAPEIPGGGAYVTPSIVQVDRFTPTDGSDAGCDVEVFGPLLRIAVVSSEDEAIEQANATRFGLAASIFTKSEASVERFLAEARAGCVNVNCGTAGASSKLPFGGLGLSGNHRPAGAFSLDYCAYPVAGMIESGDAAGVAKGMLFEDEWVEG